LQEACSGDSTCGVRGQASDHLHCAAVTFVRPQVSAVLVSAIVLSVSVLTHLIADARLSVLTELVTAAGSGAVVAVYSRFWRLAAHPPPPAIMQRLPTLQAVVAVGQTQQLAGLEVALLSIDVYDDGFVANTVVRSTLQEPDEIGVRRVAARGER
jgi:hypothetical protein